MNVLTCRYQATMQPTTKSDVYSFGVVLLELVTGRLPILHSPQPTSVIQWTRQHLARGDIEGVVDASMGGDRRPWCQQRVESHGDRAPVHRAGVGAAPHHDRRGGAAPGVPRPREGAHRGRRQQKLLLQPRQRRQDLGYMSCHEVKTSCLFHQGTWKCSGIFYEELFVPM